MKNCKNCNAVMKDSDEYCYKCGSKYETKISYCPNCGIKKNAQDIYCPNCGFKTIVETNPEQPASNVRKPVNVSNILKLTTKIALTSFSFIMILLILFAPISSSKVKTNNHTMNEYTFKYYHNGIEYIDYAIKVTFGYTQEEFKNDMQYRTEKYAQKGMWPSGEISAAKERDEYAKYINYIKSYRYLLIDDGDIVTSSKQCIVPAIFVLTICIILLITGIKSFISIFSKEEIEKGNLRLLALVGSFMLMLMFIFRLPGGNPFGASIPSFSSISCIVLVIIVFGLYYTINIVDKKQKINLVKTIMYPCYSLILIAILALTSYSFIKFTFTDSKNMTNPSFSINVNYTDSLGAFFEMVNNENQNPPQLNETIEAYRVLQLAPSISNYILSYDASTLYYTKELGYMISITVIAYVTNMVLGILMCLGFKNIWLDYINADGNDSMKNKRILTIVFVSVLLGISSIIMISNNVTISSHLSNSSLSLYAYIPVTLIIAFILGLGYAISGNIVLSKIKKEEGKEV